MSTADLFHRVSEAAAKRGERVVGARSDSRGEHWRFEFAKVGRRRAEPPPAPEPLRRVPRGAAARPASAKDRQGLLF